MAFIEYNNQKYGKYCLGSFKIGVFKIGWAVLTLKKVGLRFDIEWGWGE